MVIGQHKMSLFLILHENRHRSFPCLALLSYNLCKHFAEKKFLLLLFSANIQKGWFTFNIWTLPKMSDGDFLDNIFAKKLHHGCLSGSKILLWIYVHKFQDKEPF